MNLQVAEISRILRPGGVFVASTFITDGPFSFIPFLGIQVEVCSQFVLISPLTTFAILLRGFSSMIASVYYNIFTSSPCLSFVALKYFDTI